MTFTKLIDFPKDLLAAHDKLSRDLKLLENQDQSNEPLKTLLKFIESLEITDGVIRYTGTVPAARNSTPQDSSTGAFSGTSHFTRSEAEPSEAGERNLNSPREAAGFLTINMQPIPNYLEDLDKIEKELRDYGITLNYQLNRIRKV